MKYNWIDRPPNDQQVVDNLKRELKVSSIFAQILYQRGISSLEDYQTQIMLKDFTPYDPFLMKDMDRACDRINQAVESGEKVLIYGDYDADGVTSTSLLYETLINIGADVSYYIPDRFQDGYGPNIDTYTKVIDKDIKLLITIDNGVTGTDAFEWTRNNGIDVIVCDHHEIPAVVSPNIDCLIHPASSDSDYPNKHLAGVGVAYKLACALLGDEQEDLLDLVAIGTVADVVKLTPENRYFVLRGIEIIKTRERLGIDNILKSSKIETSKINDQTIGFQIAPRINSAGRLDKADFVVDLLTTFDEDNANSEAAKLESLNKERKELTQKMSLEAFDQVKSCKDQVIVASSTNWPEGIIGIIAAKLAEKMNRPAIVFHIDEENQIAKGSARTCGTINIYDLIKPSQKILESFGGHEGAAGLSLKLDHFDQFKEEINKSEIPKDQKKSKLLIDVNAQISDFNEDLYHELENLRPFGPGNEEPIFSMDNFSVGDIHRIGENGDHLRLSITQNKKKINVIGFQMGFADSYFLSNNVEKIAFHLSLNEWNNLSQIQLVLLDFKVNKPMIFDERLHKIKSYELKKKSWPLIFFSSNRADNFKKNYPQIKNDIFLANDDLNSLQNIVLFDQPNSKLELVDFFKNNQQLEKIDFVLLDSINLAVGGFPTTEDFKKSYKFIFQQKKIPLKNGLIDLGLSLEKTKVVLNVFFDLKFVNIKNDFLLINEKAEFQSLEGSSVYQLYRQKYEFQREFMLCPIDELKDKILSYYKEIGDI
ncbi:single-stranded-DNA-specific exonuclease RecJ [Xylocopilactobacillus apis]|uniref:Single-stranded-DNA-specific exonuclease RecJ n=1 Tax=Xylocopilactobacillus apis TaxID=2932183 RepID=A0AAU9CQP9_9LACO|nr:single-stranded-DNA-specific exonuclease RecJ [Xylocopilactobacillus apis]BDR56264.1 single-stranded-DNA-specific exonuclease [Xylocopilactobacillus apis]